MSAAVPKNRLDQFLEKPNRALFTLAFPMMAGFAVHSLYLIADTAFIGRLGTEALAGAQFVGALYMAAVALNIGFATGVTAVIAKTVGQGDRVGAGKVAASAMGLGLIIGVAAALAGFLGGPHVIPLLGATGESARLGTEYFEVLTIGFSIMFFTSAIRAVLTGEGDVKTPMTVSLISAAVNCILDPILMFVLHMGIRGAAVATVIAQVYALVAFCHTAFVKRRSYVEFQGALDFLRPKAHLISSILTVGLPAAIGQLVMSFGGILYNRVVSHYGHVAVAGFGAGSKVDLLVMLPIMALASAELSLTGMFAGAKRWDLVRSSVLYSFKIVLFITSILSLGAFLLSFVIIRVFTDDPAAVEVGHVYLRYMVFVYPLVAVVILSGRILQGLGLGLPPLIVISARILLVGVPIAYVAVYVFDAPIESIWQSMIVSGILACAAAILWIRHYIWKHPNDTGTPPDSPEIAEGG
jgi:putative MATE family efflux protein